MVASTLDPNGRIQILAWGVAESENESSWNWFLHHLRCAIPTAAGPTEPSVTGWPTPDVHGTYQAPAHLSGTLEQLPVAPPPVPIVMISDRQKGLINAISALRPGVVPAYCCYHLWQNAEKKSKGCGKRFWALARQPNAIKFTKMIESLTEENSRLGVYLKDISPNLWTMSHFPAPRFSQDTSNIAESVNSLLVEQRKLPIVPLLDGLWRLTQRQHIQGAAEVTQQKQAYAKVGGPRAELLLTPLATERLEEELQRSKIYLVQRTDEFAAMVTSTGFGDPLGKNYLVDLVNGTCQGCLNYHDRRLPCRHMLAVIRPSNIDFRLWIAPYYRVKYWQACHSQQLPTIDLSVITDIGGLNPPDLPPTQMGRRQFRRRRPGRPRGSGHIMGVSPSGDPISPADSEFSPVRFCNFCGDDDHLSSRCPTALYDA